MIKLLTIIGARPQIIKASALSRTIKSNFNDQIHEIIVHTGQHYSLNMSDVFFKELDIPQPKYNLRVGSGNHGDQTAKMISRIEEVLGIEKPDYLILYGDTNSTLAGAIAGAKTHVPIVHVEAGLRSFNKNMPEEVNRIICDHLSTYLFTPTKTGTDNLLNEGFKPSKLSKYFFTNNNPLIFNCGDVTYDNLKFFDKKTTNRSSIIKKLKIKKDSFILVTIHRNQNTDNIWRLQQIFDALIKIIELYNLEIVLPIHPRTYKMLVKLNIDTYNFIQHNKSFKIIEPVSYLNMISLEKFSKMIITDSGGVQKEAYFFKKPCIILRSETEWVELLKSGTSVLVDSDKEKILKSVNELCEANLNFRRIYSNKSASESICNILIKTANF